MSSEIRMCVAARCEKVCGTDDRREPEDGRVTELFPLTFLKISTISNGS